MKEYGRVLKALFLLALLIGGIVSAVQFVMAIRYGELGRVVVYFCLTALCFEFAVVNLASFLRKKDQ